MMNSDTCKNFKNVTQISGEAPSLLPIGRNFKLVWNDEFNGDKLDASKWGYRTNFWGRRFEAFAAPNQGAVEVKDGCVHLKLIKLPNQVPEFLLITTEPKWYRNNCMTGKGVPELESAWKAGDEFIVDYVRVYDLV